MRFRRTVQSSFLLLSLVFATIGYAQIKSAALTGTVTDPSGAVIPGAGVVVIQQATNVHSTTKTTGAGQFTVPYLAPGQYGVQVSAPGFKQYVVSNVTLDVDQTVRLAIQLGLGTATQTVEVSAAATHLQTDTSSVQTAVNAHTIENIPNITQDPYFYARLQANVSPTNASESTQSINSFGIGINGRRQYAAFGVNGGRSFSNDLQVDGLPIMGGGYNEAAIIPNTEGINEVRVISNNFSAQYGHGESGVQITTKSGTNRFHGGVNYQLRNAALNANTFANNQQGTAKPSFTVNEIGGDVGGPIIKNKVFFFFFFSSYDYLRHDVGTPNLATVPTALERVGDFSQTLTPGSNGTPIPVQIYNPYSVTQIGPDLYQRAIYPNATIPMNNAPYVIHMMSFYPLPNRTPIDPFGDQNFESVTTQTIRRDSLNNRIDYHKGNNSIYGSGGLYYGQIVQPVAFGNSPLNNDPTTTSDKNPYAEIGDTFTLSPTLLADIRVGYFRINTLNFGGNKSGFKAADYAAFGVPAGLIPLIEIYGAAPAIYPQVQTGARWSTLSGGLFATKHERHQGWSLEASMTKVAGRLTTTAGVDARVVLSNYQDLAEASVLLPACCVATGGDNDFSTNFTSEFVTADGNKTPQDASPAQQGFGGAALFTGAEQWEIRPGENVTPAYEQKCFALYTQNDWHVSKKLTVNLGLRWDLQPGVTERYNRMSGYDLSVPNPLGGQGMIAFPGNPGYSRNMWNTEWTDFQPRLGAAYLLNPSTVIRGGFGITYLPTNTGYYSGPTAYGAGSFSTGTNIQPYGLTP
jgi:Carboxypeptidase regulatory-like domain/TonB dependent receptor-like, beta-barrel